MLMLVGFFVIFGSGLARNDDFDPSSSSFLVLATFNADLSFERKRNGVGVVKVFLGTFGIPSTPPLAFEFDVFDNTPGPIGAALKI